MTFLKSGLASELQTQKRDAYDRFMKEFLSYSFKGFLVGVVYALFFFKRRFFIAGIPAGFGAGIALNNVAQEFNMIKTRETRAKTFFEKPSDTSSDLIHRIQVLKESGFH